MKSEKISVIIVPDFVLFVASFFLAYYAVIQTPHFLNYYKKLLLFEIAVWFFTFVFYHKNTLLSSDKYNRILEKIIKSNVFLILSVSLLVVFLQLPSFSYWYILLHALLYAVFEFVFILFFASARGAIKTNRRKKFRRPNFKRYSPQAVIVDFILLLLAFALTALWKFGPRASLFHGPTLMIFGIVTCLWFFSGLWSKKFRRFQSVTHASIYHVLGIYMTSTVMLVSLASFLIVLIENFQFSRMLLLAPAFFLFLLELPAAMFRYYAFRLNRMDMDIITSEHVNQFLQHNKAADHRESRQTLDYGTATGSEDAVAFIDELKNTSDKNFIYDFIRQFIDLKKIAKRNVRLYSDVPGTAHAQPAALIVHETPLSSVKYFNRYLLELHTVLHDQGYLVCCVKSSAQEKKEVFLKYPGLFAFFFFFFDYSFHRILPKLPFFNSVYHVFFNGHLKYLTRTETLGRLAFCGFRIIAEQEDHGYFYFIVQKKTNFHQDRDPIYGPLIKLKRVGYGG
ncbi:hypothetical protein JW998_14700, partial [candidate division KSB1 bacterium]|nr:hypothetical protein [candidate division KSB1 bacterium]